jgi:LmbE family N-acetylglucosaminyl deacetylase
MMDKMVKDIIKEKRDCFFISPHLDDAAFSAGGLIAYLSKKTRVIVVTVFSEAGENEHSLSALSYIKQCGYKEKGVKEFYKQRRSEDKEVLEGLGAEVIHMGYLDALWRKGKRGNIIKIILSKLLNDFKYTYPTYKFHISQGKISEEDTPNLENVKNALLKLTKESENYVIFCPIGLGRHVDHIFVREACTDIFGNVIYWEDAPYNLYHSFKDDFINKHNLVRYEYPVDEKLRHKIYPGYKSQFGKLFDGERKFDLIPEAYYLKSIGSSENRGVNHG